MPQDQERLSAIERLADLHHRKALTDDEFQREKAKVLAPSRSITATQVGPNAPPRRRSPFPLLFASVGILAVVGVGAGLALWAARSKAQRTGEATAGAPTASTPTMPPLTLEQAFDLAYPRNSRQRDGYTLQPTRTVPLQTGVALIVQGAMDWGEAGATTPGIVDIVYLAFGPSGWRVVGRWPGLIEEGSNGSAGNVTLLGDLFNSPAIGVEGSYSNQGCSISTTAVVELAPDRPYERADVVTSFEDNSETFFSSSEDTFDAASDDTAQPTSDATSATKGVTTGRVVTGVRGVSFKVVYKGPMARTVTYTAGPKGYRSSRNNFKLPLC